MYVYSYEYILFVGEDPHSASMNQMGDKTDTENTETTSTQVSGQQAAQEGTQRVQPSSSGPVNISDDTKSSVTTADNTADASSVGGGIIGDHTEQELKEDKPDEPASEGTHELEAKSSETNSSNGDHSEMTGDAEAKDKSSGEEPRATVPKEAVKPAESAPQPPPISDPSSTVHEQSPTSKASAPDADTGIAGGHDARTISPPRPAPFPALDRNLNDFPQWTILEEFGYEFKGVCIWFHFSFSFASGSSK